MRYQHTITDLSLENEYPKLIRDKIPEIIKEHDGRDASVRVMDDEKEFLSFLLKKVAEEAQELSETTTDVHLVEEIADVYEVIDSILKLKRISPEEVRNVQDEKREKRGGFDNRLLMLHNDK